jgi:signal transduction histidine kinase
MCNDYRLIRPDGSEVVVQACITPIFMENSSCLGFVITMRDMTERIEIERQKDEFLSNISHDLRTPLTSIKFAIGAVLANEPPDIAPPIQTLLRNIDVSTDRMVALVDDLLELSRIQAGRIQLHPSRCDLRDLARRCIVTVEPLIQSKRQQIEICLPSEPCLATIDARHIERAVINLLSNANKYGRENGLVKVVVRCDENEALIGVCDDGRGIAEGELENVFERFYRAKHSTIANRSGSGLGLPIAKGLVEINNGRIWLESEIGQGCSAWVALPRAGIQRESSVGRANEVELNRG